MEMQSKFLLLLYSVIVNSLEGKKRAIFLPCLCSTKRRDVFFSLMFCHNTISKHKMLVVKSQDSSRCIHDNVHSWGRSTWSFTVWLSGDWMDVTVYSTNNSKIKNNYNFVPVCKELRSSKKWQFAPRRGLSPLRAKEKELKCWKELEGFNTPITANYGQRSTRLDCGGNED